MVDLKNLLSPYKDTLVVLYLDLRIAPDGIDFSSLAALEELTLIYWPLIASTRVEFSEDDAGSSRHGLTTFDEKWLCDFGEYATQHCSRLRIICAKHNLLIQIDVSLLPDGPFSAKEIDLPKRI
ncbi:hypothetical protein ACQRIT_002821 [Beauveria bassiana]